MRNFHQHLANKYNYLHGINSSITKTVCCVHVFTLRFPICSIWERTTNVLIFHKRPFAFKSLALNETLGCLVSYSTCLRHVLDFLLRNQCVFLFLFLKPIDAHLFSWLHCLDGNTVFCPSWMCNYRFFLPNVVRRWCLGNLNGWKIYFPPERWSGNVVYCTISLLDFLNINTKLDFKTVDFGYARFWHHPVGTLDLSPPFPRSYSIPYLAPPKLLQCADWLAPSCFVFPALSTCNSTRVARDSSLCHSSARCETKPRLHCCCF